MSFSYETAKAALLEEKEELKNQLAHMKNPEREGMGYSNHMADDATEAFDQAVDEALKRDLVEDLQRVQEALAKFEKGTYGLCESCGGRIERPRLEALPQAKFCLNCQSRRERS